MHVRACRYCAEVDSASAIPDYPITRSPDCRFLRYLPCALRASSPGWQTSRPRLQHGKRGCRRQSHPPTCVNTQQRMIGHAPAWPQTKKVLMKAAGMQGLVGLWRALAGPGQHPAHAPSHVAISGACKRLHTASAASESLLQSAQHTGQGCFAATHSCPLRRAPFSTLAFPASAGT